MRRPHIILLLADQLRRDVLGCYGGNSGCSPRVDGLAEESVRFGAHTVNCPLCVPSRISMLTGLHPHVHGAIVNAWDTVEEPYGTCRGQRTFYEALAEGGYRVEHVGTNHLRFDPPLAGRNERIGFSASSAEHAAHLKQRGIQPDYSVCKCPCVDYSGGVPVMRMYTNSNTVPWPGGKEDFLDWWMADRMVGLIEKADPDEPLALLGNFWLPHCPLSCPEPYFSMFDPNKITMPDNVGKWSEGQSPMHMINLPGHVAASITPAEWRKAWAVYLGMVKLLDDCIGRVIDVLKARGFWDEAVVVFTSDHGEMLGSHRMFQKMCMYEDSLRVPLLVKEPGKGRTGKRGQLTQHLDLMATLMDYAGVGSALGAGRSFRGIVEDAQSPGRSEVFAEFNGNSGRSFQQRAIVTDHLKYIYNHGYEAEVYDLRSDPFEANNVINTGTRNAELEGLRGRLRDWMKQTGDCIQMAD